jgi:hypothetical protein
MFLKSKFWTNITVIIRCAGERTLNVCKELIIEQGIPTNQIFETHTVPFSKALKLAYQIGIKESRKYTLCIDADVLMHNTAIEDLYNEFEKLDQNICEVQGLVMDKFFGGPRPAGNHMYRTALLENALKCIPEEGTDIRPEFHTLNQMAYLGYPWVEIPLLLGLHDEEQWQRDIYRKCYVQGSKHLHLTDLFIPYWKRMAQFDLDYKTALSAFTHSLSNDQKLYINKNLDIYKQGFNSIGVKEKESLPNNSITGREILLKLNTIICAKEYLTKFPTQHGLKERELVFHYGIKTKYKKWTEKELIKILLMSSADFFLYLGYGIKNRLNRFYRNN